MQETPPRLSQLQQERSRETRRKLVDVGRRLWRAQGFSATTVGEICEAAGVAKGTFYFYFPRKEDLLVEIGLDTSHRVGDDLAERLGSDDSTAEVLLSTIAQLARRTARTPKPMLLELIQELYRHAADWSEVRSNRVDLRSVFEAIFERGHLRGEVREEFSPNELARLTTAVVLNGMMIWAEEVEPGTSLVEILTRRARIVLDGASRR
jgi:AcrR family transcriptional regulator